MSSGAYYAHSGKFTLVGIIAALVGGSLIAIACAFVYAYLDLYDPIVYINALACFGFGAVMGTTAGWLMKKGKVRNNSMAVLVGLLVGLAGLYVSWGVWLYAFLHRVDQPASLASILLNPFAAWEVILKVNEVGAWTLKGSSVTGIVLWIVWAIEALVIIGASIGLAYTRINEEPFCEQCEEWCETAKSVVVSKTAGVKDVKQQIENRNFAYIEQLGAIEKGTKEWLRIDINTCPRCRMTNALTAHNVRIEIKKGKPEEKTTAVLNRLLISQSETESVKQLGVKLRTGVVAGA